jgi:apolipoprotein D and lipocalin family protein
MKTKDLVSLSLLGVVALIFLKSCKTIPKSAKAIKPFKVESYLGKWYEIARFDYRFEKNLNNTTATHSLNRDGTLNVENSGYDYQKRVWKKATGRARFVGPANEAKLKVSFFGPFYAGYNVVALDDNYSYALVAGKNLNYLWILSREKSIPENIKQSFLQKGREIGYDTKKLVWVNQD